MKFTGQYIKTEEVVSVSYDIHKKQGSPDSIRVTYFFTNGLSVSEWICPLHSGYAGEKAAKWIRKRIIQPCNFDNLDQIVLYARQFFKIPNYITFDYSGDFNKILNYDFKTPKNKKQSRDSSQYKNNNYSDLFFKRNKPYFDTLEIFSTPYTKDEVIKNFRRLSFRYHPDHGGTSELFINLQNAKDLLLDFLNKNS